MAERVCAGSLIRRTLVSEQALADTCRGVTQRMRTQLGAAERCVPSRLCQLPTAVLQAKGLRRQLTKCWQPEEYCETVTRKTQG